MRPVSLVGEMVERGSKVVVSRVYGSVVLRLDDIEWPGPAPACLPSSSHQLRVALRHDGTLQ
jgi:hypothetical protein